MSHCVDALCIENRPRGQEEHIAEPSEENVPGEHSRHFVLPLVSSLYIPSRQTLHSEFPWVEVYFPATHREHVDCSPDEV